MVARPVRGMARRHVDPAAAARESVEQRDPHEQDDWIVTRIKDTPIAALRPPKALPSGLKTPAAAPNGLPASEAGSNRPATVIATSPVLIPRQMTGNASSAAPHMIASID